MIRLLLAWGLFTLLFILPAGAMPERGYSRPAPRSGPETGTGLTNVDPAMEARARAIGKKLRCVVCQNQSIDESDATLAADMRQLVLERLQAGDSDEQVIEYIRTRYGDFVLMKPPVKRATWALWFGPAGFLLLGGLVFWGVSRKRSQSTATQSREDGEAIAKILKKYGD